jgi:hypothetical protein
MRDKNPKLLYAMFLAVGLTATLAVLGASVLVTIAPLGLWVGWATLAG